MHEASLIAALVDRVDELSRLEKFSRVAKIKLEVGALSGVEPDCIRFCFEEVVKGSVLEGAFLELDSKSVELKCKDCGKQSEAIDLENGFLNLYCRECNSKNYDVIQGKDFRMIDLEVE